MSDAGHKTELTGLGGGPLRLGQWMMTTKALESVWGVRPLLMPLYLVVGPGMSQMGLLPELMRSLLALPALVIVPERLARYGAFFAVRGLLQRQPLRLGSVEGFLVSWLVGVAMLGIGGQILQAAGLFWVLTNLWWLIWVSIVVVEGSLVLLRWRRRSQGGDVVVRSLTPLWPAVAALLIGLMAMVIIRWRHPFPLLGLDHTELAYFHQPVLRLLEHGFLDWQNPTHKPALVMLAAVVSRLFAIDPLPLSWVGPFLLYPLFSWGFYVWAKELSGDRSLALLVSLFGVFVMVGNSAFQGIPDRLRTNSVLYALFPLVLLSTQRILLWPGQSITQALKLSSAGFAMVAALFLVNRLDGLIGVSAHTRIGVSLGAGLFLVVLVVALGAGGILSGRVGAGVVFLGLLALAFFQFHIFEAPVFLLVVLAMPLAYTLCMNKRYTPLTLALMALLTLPILLQAVGVLRLPQVNYLSGMVFEWAGEDTLGFPGKLNLMSTGNSIVALLVWGLGLALMLRRRRPSDLFVALMLVGSVFIFFLPDRLAFRTYKAVTPWAAYSAALGAVLVYHGFSHLVSARRSLARVGGVVGVVALVPLLAYPMQGYYSSAPRGQTFRTILADYEYEAAAWLRDYAPKNARIVSDYQTAHVLTQLANKVSLIEKPMRAREMSEAGRRQIQQIKENILGASDGATAYEALSGLIGTEPEREKEFIGVAGDEYKEGPFFIVVSAKTSWWMRREGIDPVYRPLNGRLKKTDLAPFLNPCFKTVYKINNELRIFQATKKPRYPNDCPSFIRFDFYTSFSQATVTAERPELVLTRTVSIDEDRRHVIFAHPPSEVAYTVPVPVDAKLHFGLGLAPGSWDQGSKGGDGVDFMVFVERDGARESVYSRYLDPKNRPEERRWIDETVSLQDYGGQTVTLIFATGRGPSDDGRYDWAVWSRPYLTQGQLVEPE